MPSDDTGSVTRWFGLLQAGDTAAAQPLWERYYQRLVRLARSRLSAARRPGADCDEEDAALSAFHSFCAGAARGRFPQVADRDGLWRLLMLITTRKAADQARRWGRQKRFGGRLVGEAALGAASLGQTAEGLDALAGPEPTPEFAALAAEQLQRLLGLLEDDSLRAIAVWKMEGFTNDEIATKLGCSLRTVANKLKLIRQTWEEER